jgi:acyl carrier protein
MEPSAILEGVQRSIAEVLLIQDTSKIQGSASLIVDLGADSLDFLDLVFQLEERFGIKIGKGEVNVSASLGLAEEETHVDGVLTPRALDRLRELLPGVDPAAIVPGLTVGEVPKLVTVQTFVAIVARKLAEVPARVALG